MLIERNLAGPLVELAAPGEPQAHAPGSRPDLLRAGGQRRQRLRRIRGEGLWVCYAARAPRGRARLRVGDAA